MHVEIYFQIPLINGFYFNMSLEGIIFEIAGTKAGHTLYHCILLKIKMVSTQP